jgi:hypothetical protein
MGSFLTSADIQALADSEERRQLRRYFIARQLREAILEAERSAGAIVRLEAALTLRFGR